jgi:Fe2+ or Zn2+ uptake regulation protein
MPENHPKSEKKTYKKYVNPHGMGVLRLKLLAIVFDTPKPLTVTEIANMMKTDGEKVRVKWVRTVLGEIEITGLLGMQLQCTQKRFGDGIYPAYYIQQPKNKKYEFRKLASRI